MVNVTRHMETQTGCRLPKQTMNLCRVWSAIPSRVAANRTTRIDGLVENTIASHRGISPRPMSQVDRPATRDAGAGYRRIRYRSSCEGLWLALLGFRTVLGM